MRPALRRTGGNDKNVINNNVKSNVGDVRLTTDREHFPTFGDNRIGASLERRNESNGTRDVSIRSGAGVRAGSGEGNSSGGGGGGAPMAPSSTTTPSTSSSSPRHERRRLFSGSGAGAGAADQRPSPDGGVGIGAIGRNRLPLPYRRTGPGPSHGVSSSLSSSSSVMPSMLISDGSVAGGLPGGSGGGISGMSGGGGGGGGGGLGVGVGGGGGGGFSVSGGGGGLLMPHESSPLSGVQRSIFPSSPSGLGTGMYHVSGATSTGGLFACQDYLMSSSYADDFRAGTGSVYGGGGGGGVGGGVITYGAGGGGNSSTSGVIRVGRRRQSQPQLQQKPALSTGENTSLKSRPHSSAAASAASSRFPSPYRVGTSSLSVSRPCPNRIIREAGGISAVLSGKASEAEIGVGTRSSGIAKSAVGQPSSPFPSSSACTADGRGVGGRRGNGSSSRRDATGSTQPTSPFPARGDASASVAQRGRQMRDDPALLTAYRRERLGATGGGAVSPPPPPPSPPQCVKAYFDQATSRVAAASSLTGGVGSMTGRDGVGSSSAASAAALSSLHFNSSIHVDSSYLQSRVRLLATTVGGFSYIPSPLSKHSLESARLFRPGDGNGDGRASSGRAAGSGRAVGHKAGMDQASKGGGGAASSVAAVGFDRARAEAVAKRRQAEAVAKRHLALHFAEAREVQKRGEVNEVGGPLAILAAREAEAEIKRREEKPRHLGNRSPSSPPIQKGGASSASGMMPSPPTPRRAGGAVSANERGLETPIRGSPSFSLNRSPRALASDEHVRSAAGVLVARITGSPTSTGGDPVQTPRRAGNRRSFRRREQLAVESTPTRQNESSDATTTSSSDDASSVSWDGVFTATSDEENSKANAMSVLPGLLCEDTVNYDEDWTVITSTSQSLHSNETDDDVEEIYYYRRGVRGGGYAYERRKWPQETDKHKFDSCQDDDAMRSPNSADMEDQNEESPTTPRTRPTSAALSSKYHSLDQTDIQERSKAVTVPSSPQKTPSEGKRSSSSPGQIEPSQATSFGLKEKRLLVVDSQNSPSPSSQQRNRLPSPLARTAPPPPLDNVSPVAMPESGNEQVLADSWKKVDRSKVETDRSGKALASAILTAIRSGPSDSESSIADTHIKSAVASVTTEPTENLVAEVIISKDSCVALPGKSEKEGERKQQPYSSVVKARWDNCIFVRAEGGRTGTLTLTETHLLFTYDDCDYNERRGMVSCGDCGGSNVADFEPGNSELDEEHVDTGSQYESGFDTDDDTISADNNDDPSNDGTLEVKDTLDNENNDDARKKLSCPRDGEISGVREDSANRVSESAVIGGSSCMRRDDPGRPDRALQDMIDHDMPSDEEPEEVRLMRMRRSQRRKEQLHYRAHSTRSSLSGGPVAAETSSRAPSVSSLGGGTDSDDEDRNVAEVTGGLVVQLSAPSRRRYERQVSTGDGSYSLRRAGSQLSIESNLTVHPPDFCREDSYDEMMDAALVRAIEEAARQRLKELDDEDTTVDGLEGKSACESGGGCLSPVHPLSVGMVPPAAVAESGLAVGQMLDREQLRDIERRAQLYLRKLEDDGDNDAGDHDDDEVSVASSGIDPSRLAAWRLTTRGAIPEGRAVKELGEDEDMSCDDDCSTVGSDSTPEAIAPDATKAHTVDSSLDAMNDDSCRQHDLSFMDSEEERRWYLFGHHDDGNDCGKSKSKGIKWPLSKLSEVYPRRYMMRDVAFEIYALSPSQLFATSQSMSSPKGSGVDVFDRDADVPLGELSEKSIYFAIPDLDDEVNDDEESVNSDAKSPRVCHDAKIDKKCRSRREDVIIALRKFAPQLVLTHWRPCTPTAGGWGGISGAGDAIRRSWASLFKRRGAGDPLQSLTRAWRRGFVSNYDYLLRLNAIAGRSRHDPSQYPIMPWVLSDYTSTEVPDLGDSSNFRDLSKPMGALNPERLRKFVDKYVSLCALGGSSGSLEEPTVPPFMYGSHYSNTGGVVLHYLVRKRPFAGLHRQLQGGRFDVPDRLFYSVAHTWDLCSRISPTEVKELTPEWYSDPSFLLNIHHFDLGKKVLGNEVNDVELPPWAEGSSQKFVTIMRESLESDVCSRTLPSWIDLIFGFKQRGSEARKSYNVFYHLTYYSPEDLSKIEDEELRTATELHIADFGHCPDQLFFKPHSWKNSEALTSSASAEKE